MSFLQCILYRVYQSIQIYNFFEGIFGIIVIREELNTKAKKIKREGAKTQMNNAKSLEN